MNHDRREQEETERVEALLRADPGPSPSELAEARLMLKRALARERSDGATPAPAPLRLASRRWLRISSQAAGFALLVALLAPVLPRVLPAGADARAPIDVVASLAGEASAMRARIAPYLPSLPSLPSFPLPAGMTSRPMEMRPSPAGGLLDWIPSLHSDAR